MIYLTSDLHLNHNKEFVYVPRGFTSVEEMNNTIISNWNKVVSEKDDVYVLGDVMLGEYGPGLALVEKLNGKIHIVFGNHDTDERRKLLKKLPNVVETADAIRLRYDGLFFFMTHYPCITSSLDRDSIKGSIINLYGHTHQITNFYNEIPFMYHVGVDSHKYRPVSLDKIIIDIENKIEECLKEL